MATFVKGDVVIRIIAYKTGTVSIAKYQEVFNMLTDLFKPE